MIKRALKGLSSGWFGGCLLFVLLSIYLYLRGSGVESREFFDLLFHEKPLILLYLLILINLLASSVLRIKKALGNEAPEPSRMDTLVVVKPEKWHEIRGVFRDYALPESISGPLYIKKGSWSFIPSVVLKIGIVVFLLSLLISENYRIDSTIKVHTGDTLKAERLGLEVQDIRAELKREFLKIGQKGDFRVDNVMVRLKGGAGEVYEISSRGPERIKDKFFRVIHLGVKQEITINDPEGQIKGFFDLDILPPGRTALVKIPKRDYFITLSLYPERTIKKGILTGEVYNLERFLYRVVIQRGKTKNEKATVLIKEGQSERLKDISIKLGDRGYFAVIKMVSDPGIWGLKAGFIIILAGLILLPFRLIWYTKELYLLPEGEGIRIGYKEEFFKKWAINRFHENIQKVLNS